VFDERGIDYHKYTIICAYQDQPLTEILI
jgi:hypothetical protein